ncbi:hypothetical protein STRIP9103_04687 [Streptomyces ipomoeae 91-03]|uniref:Uncharacterized protein n=1 Tax=Streptomyces ipomoeae 91-03 TaxID=698759 RepID=L1KRX8_9ACTN|nr:hypothetical protein STRIP9103_04687 [Streptomyces ipomoeae 91-03]
MGDDLNRELSCVGHRVMVPPWRGTRGAVTSYDGVGTASDRVT